MMDKRIKAKQRINDRHTAHGGPVSALLEECIALRMSFNGSGDPYTDEHTADVLADLRAVSETWEPSTRKEDEQLDAAVKAVVDAAINYAEWQLYKEKKAEIRVTHEKPEAL